MNVRLSDGDRELLLGTFLAEAGEHLREMEEGFVVLEAHPEQTELVHGLFRLAHSLKGDAAMVGFPRVAELAHALEDLLARLRDQELATTPDLVTLLLRAVDAVRSHLAGADPAAWTSEQHSVCDALHTAAVTAAGPAGSPGRAMPDGAPTESAPGETRTLRVDVAKLDSMLNLVGEIAIARGRVAQLLGALPAQQGQDILEAHREGDRLQVELQQQVMRARMVPTGPFFRQFTRTARDLARQHGKAMRLVIEGDDVEVDTRVVERLRDPLTHMIRNSIDHGIESPELRAALGKPAEGCLTLRAAHEGGLIVIEVRDDGAGFDRRRIAERARALGHAQDPELLPDAELLSFVFAPGFSTAETVTDISGRGVGMDVVRRNIESLRGTIAVASTEGAGSAITIRLPLTLATIDGFGVGVGGETYIVPLDTVVECLALPRDAHSDGAGRGVLNLRGQPVPYVRLRDLLDVSGDAPARQHVLVVQHGDTRAGIAVDDLFGERAAVIKSLGSTLDGLPGVSGSTIQGDGRVALILDVPAILRAAARRASAATSRTHSNTAEEQECCRT